jgi:hypothetical protein
MTQTSLRRWLPALLVLTLAAVPQVARAQFSAGGSLGYVYDHSSSFLYLSAEGRALLSGAPIEIQPRFTWQPASGGSVLTYEVNALIELPLRDSTTVMPYAGLGFVYQSVGGGSDAAGYNLIFGFEMKKIKKLSPFAQFEYSVLQNHFSNQGTLSIGVLYRFE